MQIMSDGGNTHTAEYATPPEVTKQCIADVRDAAIYIDLEMGTNCCTHNNTHDSVLTDSCD